MFRVFVLSISFLTILLLPVMSGAQPPKPVIYNVEGHPDDPYSVMVEYRMDIQAGDSLINCLMLWRSRLSTNEDQAIVVRQHCLEMPTLNSQGGIHGYTTEEGYKLEDVFSPGKEYVFQLWAIDSNGIVTVSDDYVFKMPWGADAEFSEWLHDLERRIEVIEDRLGIVVD